MLTHMKITIIICQIDIVKMELEKHIFSTINTGGLAFVYIYEFMKFEKQSLRKFLYEP